MKYTLFTIIVRRVVFFELFRKNKIEKCIINIDFEEKRVL